MARSLSSLISNATDVELDAAVQKHAEPRARLYLMAATDGSGAHIFYEDLKDLSTTASTVESFVDQLFQEPTVKSSLFRVMAAFSAAWVINAKVGIIESQQKIAYALEKQALGDLDRITKSPLIKTAVANAISKMREGLNFATTLLIAQDVNPNSRSDRTDTTNKTDTAACYEGAQLPYVGALIAGRARLWVNSTSIAVDVNQGDTPATVVQKLVNQFNAVSLSGASSYNCNLAPAEVVRSSSTRQIFTGTNGVTGAKIYKNYTYEYDAAKITILPKNYDNTLDIAVASLYLESPTQADPTVFEPGIKGLVYGTSSAASQLTDKGPHSIAIDLSTGKSTTTSTSTSGQPVSDMLFFQGTATAAENVVYTIRGGRTTSPISRTVPIPITSTAMDIVELLAADLATVAQTNSTALLAAVRPSTKLTLNGSVKTAPGLEFVAFQLSTSETKVLFTVESVPAGITFAVVPPSLAVSGEFDNDTKTVVVDFTMVRVSKTLDSATTSSTQSKGSVTVSTHNPTPGLKSIISRLRDLQNGNDPR